MRTQSWVVGAAIACLLVSTTPSQAASSDPAEALAEAARTTATMALSGIDVTQEIRLSKAAQLFDVLTPRVRGRVSAGSTLRAHGAMTADGRKSYIVRDATGRLIAAMGQTDVSEGGEWATPSAIWLQDDEQDFSRDRRIAQSTALTGLASGRLGRRPLVWMYNPVDLVVPPQAEDDFLWSNMRLTTDVSGRLIVTGDIDEVDTESDDPCKHMDVKVTIGASGAIDAAEWTDVCPGRGRVQFAATATYLDPVLDQPTHPRLTADAAMTRRAPGASVAWRALARASSRTMTQTTEGFQVTIVNSFNGETPRTWEVTYLIDGSVLGPSGQPAYSYSSSSGPNAFGWNPDDRTWMMIPPKSQPGSFDWTKAVEAAGVTATTISHVPAVPSLGTSARLARIPAWGPSRVTIALADALSILDAVNVAGQPGVVTRVAAKNGGWVYRIRPRPGRSRVVITPTGIGVDEMRVTVNAEGAVEKTVSTSSGRNGSTRYVRTIVTGPVSVARPEPPTIDYSVIAPFLTQTE